MSNLEVLHRQKGIGYLVLKSGFCTRVEWEIDLLRDGGVGQGCVRGDKHHLAAAAEDKCANLRLTSDKTAAIAIDCYSDSEALFTPLMITSATLLESCFQHVEQWQKGTSTRDFFVYVRFNDDPPLALSSQGARELAAELIVRAEHAEAGSRTAH
jgi:hypothetical protein